MRVCIITGGGSGIGAANPRRLARKDQRLMLHGQGADEAGLALVKARKSCGMNDGIDCAESFARCRNKLGSSATVAKANPQGRLAELDDVAAVVAFLLSDEAGHVTGALRRSMAA